MPSSRTTNPLDELLKDLLANKNSEEWIRPSIEAESAIIDRAFDILEYGGIICHRRKEPWCLLKPNGERLFQRKFVRMARAFSAIELAQFRFGEMLIAILGSESGKSLRGLLAKSNFIVCFDPVVFFRWSNKGRMLVADILVPSEGWYFADNSGT